MANGHRGIRAIGAYVPRGRLDRREIAATFGKGGGRGTRSVAGFDEDTTTMAVEACRSGNLVAADESTPDQLWFSTAGPAYLDKTNASTVHAALRLAPEVMAIDVGGAVRSGFGATLAALRASGETIVATADMRGGLPTSADEAAGGDGAAAVLVGDETGGPLLATLAGTASTTTEVLDRWRTPGDERSRAWEERFVESVYVPLAVETFGRALDDAGLAASDVDHLVVCGMHARAVGRAGAKLGVAADAVADNLGDQVGNTGCAHPLLALASVLEAASPRQTVAVVHLADGCDVAVLTTGDAVTALDAGRSRRGVRAQLEAGHHVPYGTFLAWRGQVTVEPPNRPGPARVSAPAAERRADWKYRFTASRDRSTQMLHLPPARVSEKGGALDEMDPVVMADTEGTIAALTVDRLAYSPSPPVVFAVIDFDGGGRAPLELADADPAVVAVGDRVEPTFRRLSTADGIHNYFWKVRPVAPDGATTTRDGRDGTS